jgi:hypothetical protein
MTEPSLLVAPIVRLEQLPITAMNFLTAGLIFAIRPATVLVINTVQAYIP